MKLYSWKDIERFLYSKYDKWDNLLDGLDVYPDTIILYKKAEIDNAMIANCLYELLPTNFRVTAEGWEIRLDLGNIVLSVAIEKSDLVVNHSVTPIFRDILYRQSSYPTEELAPLQCPVIAFHSYKGGVGRTLSLLAFAKAWSECFEGSKRRLLIIDADIEAPGLTWLNQDNMGEDCFSYLDLLDILQDTGDINKVVAWAKTKLYASNIEILTDKKTENQVFLPTYRYTKQLLDMYATPNTIVNIKGKSYALATTLSQLGQEIGVSAVLVDLRAGLSDYSATLLFDPRVKKYLVTSTSEQSVKGTELLLSFLHRGLTVDQNTILPEIILNMVPEPLSGTQELKIIIDRLKENYDKEDLDNDEYVDNFLTQLSFASELVHLSSLPQIFQMLSDRRMYNEIKKLVQSKYGEAPSVLIKATNDRQSVLKNIHELADSQITAENDSEFKVLMTKPLQSLLTKYAESIPQTIITGAKGAGKTFLYKQMVQKKSWEAFCAENQIGTAIHNCVTYFLPVLTSQMPKNLLPALKECVANTKKHISSVRVDETVFADNVQQLKKYKDEYGKPIDTQWIEFWERFLATAINSSFSTLQEANDSLQKENKKLVLLIDGLEEVFRNVNRDVSEKVAISSLCVDIINRLTTKYPYVGILIFLRYDMAQDALSVNFAQFMTLYEKFSLQWSQEEALRLALWLVKQAQPAFLDDSLDIVSANRDIIEQNLVRLWGLKLGKNSSNEAYTSRWILAALSDFNGQLQARDIIRFLKYATQNSDLTKSPPYNDRYIMPQDVRDAVIECSNEKIQEIEQEYNALQPVFEKIKKHEPKTLPLTDENNPLNMKEQQSLKSAGFWKKVGDKYYMPEIIRHALGYRYEKGARPKVLSLLLGK